MTKKTSEGPLAINGSQPCSMGDREREEIKGGGALWTRGGWWWDARDLGPQNGDGGQSRE